jgi:hypothetical protein
MAQDAEFTLEEALAHAKHLDEDFRDGISQVMEVQNHPGFRLVLAYMKTLADDANNELADVDALDTKAIMRLQTIVRVYRAYRDAPSEFIRSQVALEISEENESQIFDDS